MATASWPAVGTGGFSEADWAKYFDSPDGVVEDTMAGGVKALELSRIDASNTARIGIGKARLDGYILEVTANEDLSCPNPGSTTVYQILVKYNPTLNVAGGGGAADPLGPCRLVILTGTPPTASGETYLLLYTITRNAGQALSAATVVDYRRWIGHSIIWPASQSAAPVGSSNNYPRGTFRYDSTNDRAMIREINAAGTALVWKEIGVIAPVAFPMASGLSAVVATPPQPPLYYMSPGRIVHMQGTVRRANGTNLSTGSVVTLGTLPSGFRPDSDVAFAVRTAGDILAFVVVNSSGAVDVRPSNGQPNVGYVHLDGVSFRAA